MVPRLVHARKAKVMMGCINKTDRLDARGLNRLQRAGTLPTVWIPPGELRDRRDLTRTRMYLVAMRSSLKNRLHATLARYALTISGVSDLFGKKGRQLLAKQLPQLPQETRFATECQLVQLDGLAKEIEALEERMKAVFTETTTVRLLRSLPGIGFLLGVVIALELGDINRFAPLRGVSRVCGNDTAGTRQRGTNPLWQLATGRQPLSEMGLCRGRQQYCHQSSVLATAPCQLPVSKTARKERTCQGNWRRRASPGRGQLLGVEERRALSRSEFSKPFCSRKHKRVCVMSL